MSSLFLFAPADRPERWPQAFASGADAVILDLEDAVAPAARPAARLGFGGKLLIHPAQAGFAPSAAQVAWATRALQACDDGAVSIDGAMVDAPVRRRAEQIQRDAR